MRLLWEDVRANLFWLWAVAMFFLLTLTSCAGVGEFFKGMWTGAKEGAKDAAPKVIDELVIGNWQAAAITAGTAIVGGGLLWWSRGKKRAKVARGG